MKDIDKQTIRTTIIGISGTFLIIIFNFLYQVLLLGLSSEKAYVMAILYIIFFSGSIVACVPIGIYIGKPFLNMIDAYNRGEFINEDMLMKAQEKVIRFPTYLSAFILFAFIISLLIIAAILRLSYGFPMFEVYYITVTGMLTAVIGILILHFVFKIMERSRIEVIMKVRSTRELKKGSFKLPILVKMLVSFLVFVFYFMSLSIMMGYNLSLNALQAQLEEENTYWVNMAAEKVLKDESKDISSIKNMNTGKQSKLFVMTKRGDILVKPEELFADISKLLKNNIEDGITEGTKYFEALDITCSYKALDDQDIIIAVVSDMKIARSHATGVRKTIILLFVGSILLCLLITPLLANDINQPLQKIIAFVEDIKNNRQKDAIDVLTEDEFTDLSFAVLDMKRSLDAEKRRTEGLLIDITDTIHKQDETAERLGDVSDEQIRGATEQSLAVQEAITTAEEIVATASQISENTGNVFEVASKTLESCREGTTRSDVATKAMTKLKNHINTIAHKMGMLQAAGKSISDITEIIIEISDQTQLLSINASLEATGAGESGKRFGVVAEEVRRLAEHAAEAAEQISNITTSIDEDIQATTDATEASINAAGKAEELINEVRKSLEKISSFASETTVASQEISYSTKQQTTASRQMSDTISRVSDVARKTEISAGKLENSAEGIREITTYLKKLLEESPQA